MRRRQREPAHADAVGRTCRQVGDAVHGAHEARQVGPVHREHAAESQPVEDRFFGVVRGALESIQFAGGLLELLVLVGGETLHDDPAAS